MNETLGEVGEKCYRIHLIHYPLLLLSDSVLKVLFFPAS